ncbi:MAG: polysaccharide biosynthesis/export family protein [Gemmatimonadota bacterium]|nr:polysaccharide biosynthesis/export family protein [Gemmatimonadota bacterium]MDE3126729.1 polysaccharide biosynthesis/export family protein [Gemmatimonadota bacterium]MDE3215999.1 polysaccharide biosynthesis/export family protein [Gemmatimonadota bacterium]
MSRSLRLAVLFLAGALLPGAARAQNVPPEPHAVTDVILRPGDIMRVKFWPEQQYSGDYEVETSGIVAMPLLGEMHVAGQPLSAVRAEVRDRYRSMTTNGVAIVSLQFRVSVIGQVARPGLYPMDATQSVFDALSQAGGPTNAADLSQIRLLRADHVIVLNAAEELRTGAPMLSVLLESGDRIVVPEKQNQWLTWTNALTALQTVGLIIALARHP